VLVNLPGIVVVVVGVDVEVVAVVEVDTATVVVVAVTVWLVQGWHTIISRRATLADSHHRNI